MKNKDLRIHLKNAKVCINAIDKWSSFIDQDEQSRANIKNWHYKLLVEIDKINNEISENEPATGSGQ